MAPLAKFDWEMPSRALGWIDAWDAASQTYAQDYVSPEQWRVILEAKESDGDGSLIDRYRWEIEGLDGNSFSLVDEDSSQGQGPLGFPILLRTRFVKQLPQLGRYKVTLTVINKRGERSAPFSRTINLQDLLIVSLGDSMASGEGNPDKAGGTVLDLEEFPSDPHWTDRRCHRSRRSGHARAALRLEWRRRSVTFLSFACSGAGVQSGLLGKYDGIDAPSGLHAELQSQTEAALTAIGKRDIDVLLITAGLNDLGLGKEGFSSVIIAFAKSISSADAQSEVSEKLLTMPNKYNRIAWALSRLLHNRVKRVYLTEYPYHIFQPRGFFDRRDGCDFLISITDSEGDFLFEKGKELTKVIRDAVSRHRWNFVTGIKDEFEGHGYCSPDNWYVKLTQSLIQQENVDGTIHPNGSGQRAIADRIIETVRMPVRDLTYRTKQVRVVFETVKVIVPTGTDAVQARNVFLGANGQENSTGPVLFNREISLPDHFTCTFIVDNRLSGRLVEVTGRASLPKLNPEEPGSSSKVVEFLDSFGLEDNYGEGAHVHRVSNLEVHYRVEVSDTITSQPKQVNVVFEKIKVIAPTNVDAFHAKRIFLGADGQSHSIGPVLLNREINQPESDFSFPFVADLDLPGRLVEVKGGASLPKLNPEDPNSFAKSVEFSRQFGPEDNFGEGDQVHRDSTLEVHYRIDIRNVPAQGGSPFEPIPVIVQKPTTDVRVTVTFEKLKVNFQADAVTTTSPVELMVSGVRRRIGPVILNRDITLPESEFTLSFIVDNGQESPMIEISGHTGLPKSSPEEPGAQTHSAGFTARFGRAQNFGKGSHMNPGAELEVHYRVTTQNIGGPPEFTQ